MAGVIYKKPVLFAIVSLVVILSGSLVMVFFPMLTTQMHPKLENLKPYTALELAGRDIYQREGCNNCHTQTVRPLKSEVMRYGEYSKAGEFAYDYPFLWGSKRTGPDLARIGKKYPDAWHERHFDDPRAFYPESNMPSYGWLKEIEVDPEEIRNHMDALGFPYTEGDITDLKSKNELDALVAYMQVIGTAVTRPAAAGEKELIVEEIANPLAGDAEALLAGRDVYEENCSICHGDNGEGDIGPSLVDNLMLNAEGDLSDAVYYVIISEGLEEGVAVGGRSAEDDMPGFGEDLGKDEIWSVISYIRSMQSK